MIFTTIWFILASFYFRFYLFCFCFFSSSSINDSTPMKRSEGDAIILKRMKKKTLPANTNIVCFYSNYEENGRRRWKTTPVCWLLHFAFVKLFFFLFLFFLVQFIIYFYLIISWGGLFCFYYYFQLKLTGIIMQLKKAGEQDGWNLGIGIADLFVWIIRKKWKISEIPIIQRCSHHWKPLLRNSIVIRSGHGDLSSKPERGCLHST